VLATELCRQARSVGADPADLLDRIREVEATRERTRQDAEVAAVCGQLAGPDPRPGLGRFLALDPELRHRVRSQRDLPLFDWLEQVTARSKGTQHGAAIDAVFAVAAAASAAERGDDEATIALLEPRRSLIAGLARANELQAEARGRIAARRRTAAASALDQARLALARGDLETCERLCDQADGRDLDRALRPALDQVRHEVRTLLEGVSPGSVAPEWLPHHCHLLGIAWLRTGAEVARARELWQLGRSQEHAGNRLFKCRLDVCLELVEPLPDPLPDAWWGPGSSLVRQLRGAIASADRLTAAGQPRAALDVMRRRAVTANQQLQSAARLAAAWLAVDPGCTNDRFSAAIALARFVRLPADRAPDLPIEGAWSPDQLTSLAERAERWLATWHERQ
jgi:hypothetical protein